MHNLSDAFALVGPFSQPRTLPGVNTQDVQLRTNDGQAHVTIKPDYTIAATNPAASIVMTPGGMITGEATTSIDLRAPAVNIATNALTVSNLEGGGVSATIIGDITQTGGIVSTGDHVAGGISQIGHVHEGVATGDDLSGGPV